MSGQKSEAVVGAGAREARSSAAAWVPAWLVVGAATAVAFELWVPRGGKTSIRLLSLLHALALHLALALVCLALLDGARRLIASARMRFAALVVVGGVLGVLLVEEDLRGLADLLPGPAALWSHGLAVLGGSAPVVAFAIGTWAGRSRRRRVLGPLAGALALVVAVIHHRVLTSGYEGIHFAATAAAAALLAGVLEGWGIARRAPGLPRRAALGLALAAAVVAACGVVVDPGSDVVVLSRRLPGNAVPGLAARARQLSRGKTRGLAPDSPWLRDRTGLSPIAPSSRDVLPDDAIVVLITIDAVRADLMTEPTLSRLPNLKRLTEASFSFPQARSAAPHTTPSLSALMMGKYYSQVVWTYGKAKQPKPYTDTSPTIAEVLAARKVKSAAYPALGQISEEYGLGRGFTEPAKRLKSAGQIVSAIVKRVKKGSKGGLFVYTHIMEPHYPYKGSGKAGGGTDQERYLGEVASVDEALAPLVDLALDSELKDRLVLVISADHGEAFGEHDSTQHGTTLYEEMMRVPLIIHIPGRPAGTSDAAVSLVDVGPTIFDLFGAPTPSSFMGQSLVPLMMGRGPAPDRPLILESGRMMRALIEDGRWKYIRDDRHGTQELFNLQSDPTESQNLFDVERERATRLDAFVGTFFDVHTHRAEGYTIPYFP